MNIQQAKEQIKKTMEIYFLKDDLGHYLLPPEQQRPVFLMGPPGIGKTAIMKQITAELGVGLVTYSMTHHTRQSALGLPFITEKEFDGKNYSIAEYTMSEIIASVFREIEQHGYREGILFLDEINCVSETLAPAMLQFLQYKTFGMHAIPQGWLVVTAGNPPEYNASARNFDMATWDRLKRMEVEPDLEAWKEYARERGVHPAIRSYLELHPDHFYHIERTLEGQQFVTARGWEDLSVMLKLYERQGMTVDAELFAQYLQHERIAEEFEIYFELYRKYRSDYQIEHILAGEVTEEIRTRAASAALDERITVVGMLQDAMVLETRQVMEREHALIVLRDWLKAHKEMPASEVLPAFFAMTEERTKELEQQYATGRMTERVYLQESRTLELLKAIAHEIRVSGRESDGFEAIKASYMEKVTALKEQAAIAGQKMDHSLAFCEEAYANGVEMLLFLAELTEQEDTSSFIARYGCERYVRCSKELMLQDKLARISALV